jgi:4-amino-4-deoxy-L-arabinose transferase-like glycosyltransferase
MSFRLPFSILLALALCIRLVYVFCLPLGQTVRYRLEGLNDEPSHLNYVHYLAEHKQFPLQNHHARENDAFVRNEFEYFQPPVYYMLGAGCELLVGKSNSKLACRFLSFFLGIFSLLVIYKIFFRLGFPGILCQGAALFAAFLPIHAYFCSVVSNDSLCWLVCLLLTLEICTGWGKKTGVPVVGRQIWFSALRTGALLGIGMLIKSSLFIFYPVLGLFFLYRWFISKDLRWIGALAVSFLFSGLLSVPWYLHNLHQYGSFMAFGIGNGPHQFYLFSGNHFMDLLKWTLYYFWFPMQHVQAPRIRGVFLW